MFRAGVRFVDDCLWGRVLTRIVTGKGKAAQATWVFWEVRGEPPRPAIRMTRLDGRHYRFVESELVRITQHAL